nr:hypothetical protein [Nitrospiraceae bacterium]
GNVRELANTIERLVIMAEKDVLEPEDLPYNLVSEGVIVPQTHVFDADTSLGAEVKLLERQRIIKALRENNLIQQKTAFALGITPRKLAYRIKKYGIDLSAIR